MVWKVAPLEFQSTKLFYSTSFLCFNSKNLFYYLTYSSPTSINDLPLTPPPSLNSCFSSPSIIKFPSSIVDFVFTQRASQAYFVFLLLNGSIWKVPLSFFNSLKRPREESNSQQQQNLKKIKTSTSTVSPSIIDVNERREKESLESNLSPILIDPGFQVISDIPSILLYFPSPEEIFTLRNDCLMRYRFSSEDQLEATMFPFSIKFVPTTFVICVPGEEGKKSDKIIQNTFFLNSNLYSCLFDSTRCIAKHRICLIGTNTGEIYYGDLDELKEVENSLKLLYKLQEPIHTITVASINEKNPKNNCIIIIGKRGTVLVFELTQREGVKSVTTHHFFIPSPVHSVFVWKNEILTSVEDGKILLSNFHFEKESGPLALNSNNLQISRGHYRFFGFCTGSRSILFLLHVRGNLSMFFYDSSNTISLQRPLNQLHNDIKDRLISIGKVSNEYQCLLKKKEEINQKITQTREAIKLLQTLSSKFELECTLSPMETKFINDYPSIQINLINHTKTIFSIPWSLAVHLNSQKQNIFYSFAIDSLSPKQSWSSRIPINLNQIDFPIRINVFLTFTTQEGSFMIPIHQDRFDSLHFIQENSQVHVNNAFMNDYHSIQNPFLKSLRKHLESLSKSQATSFPKLFLEDKNLQQYHTKLRFLTLYISNVDNENDDNNEEIGHLYWLPRFLTLFLIHEGSNESKIQRICQNYNHIQILLPRGDVISISLDYQHKLDEQFLEIELTISGNRRPSVLEIREAIMERSKRLIGVLKPTTKSTHLIDYFQKTKDFLVPSLYHYQKIREEFRNLEENFQNLLVFSKSKKSGSLLNYLRTLENFRIDVDKFYNKVRSGKFIFVKMLDFE